MAEILVLANETIGGAALLDAVRARHAEGDARFFVVVPQTRPRHGNVIFVDLEAEGLPFDVTLVLANQTVAGKELIERLEALAESGPRRFIIVVPQDSGDGLAVRAARERLRTLLASLEADNVVAAGMIGDPDPYTATMNAVQYFHISEIVISTLPEGTSKWVADKLVERVAKATGKPVEHVEVSERVEA